MKTPLAVSLTLGLVVPLAIGATVTLGSSTDTECWDEYNKRGTRMYRTVTPKDLPVEDCRPADSCLWGYRTDGRRNRLYVPHGADPATACDDLGTTTTTTATTIAPTDPTDPPTNPPTGDRFETLPVGAALPSDSDCAAAVRPMTENRPENATANATVGDGANTTYPRVTGNFTGTTDEIIQWTACKWGIDEDWVRAQIVNESYWNQNALGDFTTNPDHCIPGFPIGSYDPQYSGDSRHDGQCPESIGLGQVRWFHHQSAFDNDNATRSSAYNLDYTYAVWRTCFEGGFGWLNDVEGRGDYAAGDASGCLGVWFSGRWYTQPAREYIGRFEDTLTNRTWEQEWFPPASPTGLPPITTTPPATTEPITTTPPATTQPTTTAPATTAPATTAPAPTTAAPTTVATTVPTTQPPTTTPPVTPPGGAKFVETFDGNTGFERFAYGAYHREVGHHWGGTPEPGGLDNNSLVDGSWTGDHDENCGSPATQRQLGVSSVQDTNGSRGWVPEINWNTDQFFYNCRDHLMTSMGGTAGYSILWFSPDMTFDSVDEVSFDVNLTDLGSRQWIKWGVVSESVYQSTYRGGFLNAELPGFIVTDTSLAGTASVKNFVQPGMTIATWSGAGTDTGFEGIGINGRRVGTASTNGSDKATRFPVSLADNGNGTITATVNGNAGTTAGSFPECPCRVVFYDHNYDPDKDGRPVGHTWHWDNFVIR